MFPDRLVGNRLPRGAVPALRGATLLIQEAVIVVVRVPAVRDAVAVGVGVLVLAQTSRGVRWAA